MSARKLVSPLLWLVGLPVVAYVVGVLYAWGARVVQDQSSPFRMAPETSFWASVRTQLGAALGGDFGTLPGQFGPAARFVAEAASRSVFVLALAFGLSAVVGVGLAFVLTRSTAGPRGLAPFALLFASTPPFLLAVVLSAVAISLSWTWLPAQGHWLLPVFVLAARPALQAARVLGGLVGDEHGRQYVVAARGAGNSWGAVRRRHIWPNVVAPALLLLAASFRVLAAEAVVLEWLLNYPGLGRFLAAALIVPKRTDAIAALFLEPHLTALSFAVLAMLLALADVIARAAATASDPRLRHLAEQADPNIAAAS
jgi:peptide/nickel transport system permease protein